MKTKLNHPKLNHQVLGWARTAVVAGVGLWGVSCSLPPREVWQRVKEDGVLKAFYVPKRSGVGEDRTRRLAGADLSVEPAAAGRAAGAPVAEPAGVPGYVYSPRTATRKLVNVKDFAAGETVLCPYTMEPFVVPGGGVSRRAEDGMAQTSTFGPAPLRAGSATVSPPPEASVEPSVAETLVAENPAVEELTPASPSLAEAGTPLIEPVTTAPMGMWVEEKPGHVYSPFAARHQLVDVTGIAPGTEVHCPFSGRIFRVPAVSDSLAQSLPEPGPVATAADGLAAPDPVSPGVSQASDPAADPVLADAAAMRELAVPTPSPEAPGSPAPEAPAPPKYGAVGPALVPPAPGPASPATAVDSAMPKGDPKPKPPVKPAPAPEPPTATWAPGKPGLVQSPFGKPGQLVDVTGKPTGSKVVCPYTNKAFLVPKP
jgi:hypothetical protein